MKRVKRQIKQPANPLFEEWLIGWQKDAAEKGSEMQHCFGKALRSLRKYPFPLLSGKECIILENFGKKICDMLDKRLEEHKKLFTEEEWLQSLSSSAFDLCSSSARLDGKHVETHQDTGSSARLASPTLEDDGILEVVPVASTHHSQASNPKSSSKRYIPKYRSGAFAVLIALVNLNQDAVTKEAIQSAAQDFCDVSFTKPLPGSFFTAWSSVATLLKNELVVKLKSRPIKYQLTDSGRELGMKLKEQLNNIDNATPSDVVAVESQPPASPTKSPKRKTVANRKVPRCKAVKGNASQSSTVANIGNMDFFGPVVAEGIISSNEHTDKKLPPNPSKELGQVTAVEDRGSSISTCSSQETVYLAPGQFDIILIVDIHETEMKKRERIDVTLKELQKRGIRCESRHLTVGDFVWVCRYKDNVSAELVLPYVVERKRMDDFGSSIKDGRFHEQKFRLKQSGLSEMIYLVEKFGKENQRLGLPLATIQQAAVNTQVVDGFTVMFSRDHEDSMRYLACLTRHLIRIFRMKSLMSCEKNEHGDLRLDSDLISLMCFSEFNKGSSKIKNFTIKEMMIKHLLQLKGVSVDKATVIADRYETPSALMEALTVEGEKLLTDLPCGALRRLGPACATSIHQLYTRLVLE